MTQDTRSPQNRGPNIKMGLPWLPLQAPVYSTISLSVVTERHAVPKVVVKASRPGCRIGWPGFRLQGGGGGRYSPLAAPSPLPQ